MRSNGLARYAKHGDTQPEHRVGTAPRPLQGIVHRPDLATCQKPAISSLVSVKVTDLTTVADQPAQNWCALGLSQTGVQTRAVLG